VLSILDKASYSALVVEIGSVGKDLAYYQNYMIMHRVKSLKNQKKRPIGFCIDSNEGQAVIVYQDGGKKDGRIDIVERPDSPPVFEGSNCLGVLRDSKNGLYLSVIRKEN
jgi:hypothetical protein